MTPDQISKLPPELQRAAELCKRMKVLKSHADRVTLMFDLANLVPAALTYCLQMQEERDAAARQRNDLLARIFRDGGQRQDALGVERACELADQLCADYIIGRDVAEATITTLTREKSELIAEIFRLHCTTGAALSHTPEGKI